VSVAEEVAAIRSSAGLSRPDHVAMVHVGGANALELLQRACTQSPYIREGRVRHALLLREDASVLAEVLVVKVEDAFLVLAEGLDEAALVAWLDAAKRAGEDAVVRPTSSEWALLGVDGPYAWEVIAGLVGPVVLGLPYLALLRKGDVVVLRAGKTGEYGYFLLVPRASLAETEARLAEIGRPLDLAPVGLEALDVCALESWHFSIRALGGSYARLTPVELQLQWRVAHGREFIGSDALRAIRAEGTRPRLTCFVATGPTSPGERVTLGELDVGEVFAACASPTLGQTVGAALLARRFAHPHLSLTAGKVALRTCTASLVLNKSLTVQPHKDAYATRHEVPA